MAVGAADVTSGDAGAVVEEMGAEEREPADVFRVSCLILIVVGMVDLRLASTQ